VALIDKEWEKVEACFKKFLLSSNFDKEGRPRVSLSALTKPLLYKLDNLDCS
jgi:hypothetical protein